ncbi:effector-associated constant component EACC1 [Streptomyces lincolnensis]|uniref:effector-associated constant component EACC1 n=1 Tax=Streptomyces lincolnensis TaxID=1915 RepID=UPI001CEF8F8E
MLRRDDDLRRHAELRLRQTWHTGGFLGSVEVVELIVGQTIALANLAVAYATWRQSRTTRAR